MKMRLPILPAVGAAAVMAVGFVSADQGLGGGQGGQSSATMLVNANVIRKCTIQTQPLPFGNYDPVQANATAPLEGQTTLTVACTKGTAVSIGMDSGANNQGLTRRMVSNGPGGAFLQYEIYRDSARTQRWGDDGNQRLDGGIAPSRDPRQFIAYGRVPGAQDVPEGAFQDTILVTVQF
jgi:spore coat protein U-like protein